MRLQPVILCGGRGSRLWPLSQRSRPKQFLALTGRESLFQQTIRRVADNATWAPSIIVTSREYRCLVSKQLAQIGQTAAAVILEPFPRNTAAAVLTAALLVNRHVDDACGDPLLLILPSDHVIDDVTAFRHDVLQAAAAAQSGQVVAFGVPPTRPEPGYGYILTHAEAKESGATLPVRTFIEKPDVDTARKLMAAGNCFWNAGIFLARVSQWLALFHTHAPDLVTCCEAALAEARRERDCLHLAEAWWRRLRNISVDLAVMEKTEGIRCRPLRTGWSDLGSFQSLWEWHQRDGRGNVSLGNVFTRDAWNCFAQSVDGRPLCLLGVEDLVAICTRDVVLVTTRTRARDVGAFREITFSERDLPPPSPSSPPPPVTRIHRPWGWFEILETGSRYQIKKLALRPGARLSLQRHRHRAEHWVVMCGSARAIRDGEEYPLAAGDSIHLPVGCWHRLENTGSSTLIVTELQTGICLEEDIERMDDDYARDEPAAEEGLASISAVQRANTQANAKVRKG